MVIFRDILLYTYMIFFTSPSSHVNGKKYIKIIRIQLYQQKKNKMTTNFNKKLGKLQKE